MDSRYDDKWSNPNYLAAIERNKRANAATGRRNRWIARDERAQEVIDFLDPYMYEPDGFLSAMANTVYDWGELSEKQYAAVIKIIDERKARAAEREVNKLKSQHVGTVGQRQAFEAEVVFATYYDTQWGTTFVTGMKSGDDIIVAKGTSDLSWAKKGDKVEFMAMVKEHGERDGEKQTIVNRPTKIFINGEAY